MRVATLSCGAVVIQSNGAEWLFGAPKGVGTALKEAGLDTPRYVFTTTMRVPGVSDLSDVVRFKGDPLSMGGLSAKPIKRKHGTDYIIEADGVQVLFSERGDVGTTDLDGYDLAIIKNKNRADAWGNKVITWPWPDNEFELTSYKVYSDLDEVPANLKKMDDVPLTLAQANSIVRQAEGIPKGEVDNPWAVAKASFTKTHVKKDRAWVERKGKAEKEETLKQKVSKADANYRSSEGDKKCGNCEYFDGSGACSRVEGDISPNSVSDIYAPVEVAAGEQVISSEVSRSVIKELETILADEGLDIPDTLPEDGTWSTVFKDVDSGKWCWAGITSTAIWDLQEEFVTPKAMDWAIKFASVVGNGPLRYRHIPGLDGGTCTKQVRAGDFLFERGEFDDSPIGQAMRKKMANSPSLKLSPGLAYGAKDLVGGVYQRMLIFERSITPSPANPITAILTYDDGGIAMKQLSEEQLKQAADELNLDLDYVRSLHTQAVSSGVVPTFKEFMTTLKEGDKDKPFGGKKAKPFKKKGDEDEDEEDEGEDEEEESKSKVKALLGGLDPDQRDQLKELLGEVEIDEQDPVDSLRVDMEQQFKELRQSHESMTGAIGQLAEALTATRTKEGSQDPVTDDRLRQTVEQILSVSPRRQAAHFASKEELGGEVSKADKAILAKLEDIQTQVKSATRPFAGPGGGAYDSFTSTRLNAGRDNAA